jgi:hypothetical protein
MEVQRNRRSKTAFRLATGWKRSTAANRKPPTDWRKALEKGSKALEKGSKA